MEDDYIDELAREHGVTREQVIDWLGRDTRDTALKAFSAARSGGQISGEGDAGHSLLAPSPAGVPHGPPVPGEMSLESRAPERAKPRHWAQGMADLVDTIQNNPVRLGDMLDVGIAKGIAGIGSLPRTLVDLGVAGVNKASDYLDDKFDKGRRTPDIQNRIPIWLLPDYESMIQEFETGKNPITGKPWMTESQLENGKLAKPKNAGEHFVQTTGEFATGGMGGAGRNVVRRAARVLVPAAASDAAGAATEGTPAEPWARGIGGLSGAGVAHLLTRPGLTARTIKAQLPAGVPPAIVDQTEALMQAAASQGISRPEAFSQAVGRQSARAESVGPRGGNLAGQASVNPRPQPGGNGGPPLTAKDWESPAETLAMVDRQGIPKVPKTERSIWDDYPRDSITQDENGIYHYDGKRMTDAEGNLLLDSKSRPLKGDETIIGWYNINKPAKGLSPSELDDYIKVVTGKHAEEVTNLPPLHRGTYKRESGVAGEGQVSIDKSLHPDDKIEVKFHEGGGHATDDLLGARIPDRVEQSIRLEKFERALRDNYHQNKTGRHIPGDFDRSSQKLTGPEQWGYKPANVPFELNAEFFRTLYSQPNTAKHLSKELVDELATMILNSRIGSRYRVNSLAPFLVPPAVGGVLYGSGAFSPRSGKGDEGSGS